jgi:hypothetical protein
MDYDGDDNDYHGTDGYGGGDDYESMGDSCNSGCNLYCTNPPLTYNDPGLNGWVSTDSIVLAQDGDTGVSYDANYGTNGAWDTFATIKISTFAVDGDLATLAGGGLIDHVRLKKTDSNGTVDIRMIDWSQFTLNNFYYEYTHTYNAYLGTVLPDMAVLDGEEYTFSLDIQCMNGAGYIGLASSPQNVPNPSPEPSIVITYNN